ncbi:MAG: UbiA family prenyltransferase [Synergistaceae bacterium]|nr:UbiA family prenyltransferase [Synergistaceae bacterium]
MSHEVNPKIIWLMWIILALAGLAAGLCVNAPFFAAVLWLWVMGIAYNVEPLRTKDIPVLDVISESVNNAIRLVAGWVMVSGDTLPPLSLIAGYWMGGAFLMGIKRYAEYRMIAVLLLLHDVVQG